MGDPLASLLRMNAGRRLALSLPGVSIALIVAVASAFLGDNLGGPRMLYALLLGMALASASSSETARPGVDLSASFVLRFGVMLLGAGVTLAEIRTLGPWAAGLVGLVVTATLTCGFLIAKAFKLGDRHAVISAGSVAICGASAALAVASVLPRTERADQQVGLTIAGVTLLSTLAMVIYPVLADALSFTDIQAGVFFGAAIHDVAQVVAAGHIVSPEAAETAAIVKLMRVACLVPAVVVIALVFRGSEATTAAREVSVPLLPWFLIGFVVLALLSSVGFIPASASSLVESASRWCLLIAVAAIGMKTSPAALFRLGVAPLGALVAQSIFIAAIALGFITLAPGL